MGTGPGAQAAGARDTRCWHLVGGTQGAVGHGEGLVTFLGGVRFLGFGWQQRANIQAWRWLPLEGNLCGFAAYEELGFKGFGSLRL